jgi:2-dehydro-3-deoxygluconokinase
MKSAPSPRIVTFGEVMGRLATPGYQRFQQAIPGRLEITFAGAEVNVAVSFSQLGGNAAFVTALPEHAVADALLVNLRALGVDTRCIVRSPQGRLGLFFLEKGVNQRPANVIYDREGSCTALLPAEYYDWDSIFEGATWFHLSGITPAISRNAAEVALHALKTAVAKGVRVSFDMNLRTKLWRWEPETPPQALAACTVREMLPLVDLFLGGPDDVALLCGRPVESVTGNLRVDAARQLIQHFPRISQVAMTIRHAHSASQHDLGGMLYLAGQDQAFHALLAQGQEASYAIPHLVDRLGGGDAFAAGLLFAGTIPELSDPQTAVEFATAASCLAHSTEGDFHLATRAEVESLVQNGSAGRVNR